MILFGPKEVKTMRISKKCFSLFLRISLLFGAIAYDPSAILAQSSLFNRLVNASKAEMATKGGKLSIGLEWQEGGKPVADAFAEHFSFIREVSFERVTKVDLMFRILMEYKGGRVPKYDVMHTSFETWPTYQEAGVFARPPFSYLELLRSLPPDWSRPDPRIVDPEGYFLATTALARGIVYNKNLVPPDKAPKSWKNCLDPALRGRFLYDPRSKLTALLHDPKTREWFLNWLKGIVENKAVLGRGQTENIDKVAAGEYPIFCGANYHGAMKAIDEGAPLDFIFPEPFPMDFGTQIHVLKWSTTPSTTQLFAVWLATKAQPLVEKHGYRGFPWDPNSRKYPLAKGKYVAVCDVDCLKKSEKYDAEHAKILRLPAAK